MLSDAADMNKTQPVPAPVDGPAGDSRPGTGPKARPRGRGAGQRDRGDGGPPRTKRLTDDKLLVKIRLSKQGEKFADLYKRGDTSGYADPYRADLALCCILAWWCQKDPVRVDRLFRGSKLYRAAWDEPRGEGTYGQGVIATAIAHTDGEYDPRHATHRLMGELAAAPVPPSDQRPDVGVEPDEGGGHADGADGADDADDTGDAGGRPDPSDGPSPGGEESKAGDDKKKPAAATRLVELAREAGVKLLHTPDQVPYAQVPRDGHLEVHAVKSTRFRQFLSRLYFEAEGKAANGEAMVTAINTLEAFALFEGPEHPVCRRVAPHPGGGLVLDLCDDRWRAVVVRPDGWQVTDSPGVLFTRSKTMFPLPEPARGGNLAEPAGS